MQYSSWFKGFTFEALKNLVLEHPYLAEKLEIDIMNKFREKYLSNQSNIQNKEKKDIYDKYKKELLLEVDKISNEAFFKHIWTENIYSIYKPLREYISSEHAEKVFNENITFNIIQNLRLDSEIIITKFNIIKEKLSYDLLLLDQKYVQHSEKLYIESKFKEGTINDLINDFTNEINTHDWRKLSQLTTEELQVLINLKVINEEFLEIKDGFLSEDIKEQLKLYTNLDKIESIVIGCDHKNIQITYNNDGIPALKNIPGGCGNLHSNDSNHCYVTNYGKYYNIFMNILDLEKLQTLLNYLPNVKKIYDHTREILNDIINVKNKDYYHSYTKSTKDEIWNGYLQGSKAAENFLEWLKILKNHNIELYNYNLECTEQEIKLIQEKCENFIIGENLQNHCDSNDI